MIEQNKKQSKPIQINVYLESFTGRKNVRVYYSGALSRPRQGRLKIWMEDSIFFSLSLTTQLQTSCELKISLNLM